MWPQFQNLLYFYYLVLFSSYGIYPIVLTQAVVRWVCNFTGSITMYRKFSHILLTNVQKCLEKILLHVKPNFLLCQNFFWFTLVRKSIFLQHFWMLVNKIQNNFVYIVIYHVKLQTHWTKIVEMRGKSLFYAPVLTFQINDQKTHEFRQLLGHPLNIFCAGSG
jgi:hypothetical protein